MRRSLVQAVLGSLVAIGLQAQVPPDSLTLRSVPGGVTLMLPDSWHPLSDSVQAQVDQILDTTLANTRDSTLKAALKNGRPVILLQEVAAANATVSANLNVAPSPGATAAAFDKVTQAQLAETMAPVCNSLRAMLKQAGQLVVTCDPPVLDTVAGRTIVVTHVVRSGPSGFVTFWLVQYPDLNSVYTLTLNAPQAEDARYTPLFKTIWHSLKLPPS